VSERELLRAELDRLEEERSQLEKALPPHGLKPAHLQRLEELEERLEALKARLVLEESG